MRENEGRRERKYKAAARYRLRMIAGEKNPRGADSLAIPDYVMPDFGFPEELRDGSNARHRVPGVSDVGEGLG